MPTLQELCDAVPDGGTVDLGSATYTVGDDPTQPYPWFLADTRHDLTITGSGATIVAQPSKLRGRPALLVRGTNITLAGQVTIQGDHPTGGGYDSDREAQHGIELSGATAFLSSWNVSNVWGDGYYIGKRAKKGLDRWSTDVEIHGATTTDCGRHHYSPVAVDGLKMGALTLNGCGRSAVDVEPPGHPWGCRDFVWTNSDVSGGFEFCLANKGVGNGSSVQDITLDGIRCHGQYFGVRIVPPEDTRRQRYILANCSSDTLVHHSPITAWNVDGLTVGGITQPIDDGVALVRANNCTGVTVEGGTVIEG